jgi:ATP-dependent Lon protease
VIEDTIGMATGLAWTEVGGDVLEVEIAIMKGKGGLTLTGQLGEVMQESAQAAMSYIRSRGKDFGLKDNFYSEQVIHVHVPEGAIPKDGPSAGITLCTAITSALTKVPVRKDTAMTGEITLRGRVLAVGGLKEKILAAARMGFKRVIVPKQCQKDIKEFEGELDKSLALIYVETMDEVLSSALTKSPLIDKKFANSKKNIVKKNKK